MLGREVNQLMGAKAGFYLAAGVSGETNSTLQHSVLQVSLYLATGSKERALGNGESCAVVQGCSESILTLLHPPYCSQLGQ